MMTSKDFVTFCVRIRALPLDDSGMYGHPSVDVF